VAEEVNGDEQAHDEDGEQHQMERLLIVLIAAAYVLLCSD
jgi:hypothetical protein